MIFYEKIIISLFIGALLGLERQYAKKIAYVGIRTFAIISLFATLLTELSVFYSNFLFVLIGILIVFFFIGMLYSVQKKGFTTHFSLLISYLLGLLVGLEFVYEAIFTAIICVTLLHSKERLAKFVGKLTEKEVLDFIEFLIVIGLIYPLLPSNINLQGITINISSFWTIVFAIVLINFLAFMTSKKFKENATLTCFLSGVISTTASLAFLKQFKTNLRKSIFLVYLGGFSRNFVLAIFFLHASFFYFIISFLFLFGVLALCAFSEKSIRKIQPKSPFNILQSLKIGFFVFGFLLLLKLLPVQNLSLFIFSIIGGAIHGGAFIASLPQTLFTPKELSLALLFVNLGGVLADLIIFQFYKDFRERFNPVAKVVLITCLLSILIGLIPVSVF
ncbi:MAG: MgtC/SapB family protein [archaeon]